MKYYSQNEKRSKLYAVPYCRTPRNVDLSTDETVSELVVILVIGTDSVVCLSQRHQRTSKED